MDRVTGSFEVDIFGNICQRRDDGRESHVTKPIAKLIADDQQTEKQMLTCFSRSARDLLRVASAVYHVDRLVNPWPSGSRGLKRQVGGMRVMTLIIAVEDPDRWTSSAGALHKLLSFLTDDSWNVSFSGASYPQGQQPPLLDHGVPPSSEVALFSGGLDSMAGLLARHRTGVPHFVTVSCGGTSIRRGFVRRGIQGLRSNGVSLVPLFFRNHLFRNHLEKAMPNNPWHRSRAFLFWSVGASVANALELGSVAAYESGPGAVNLPLTEAQVGAQNTRAMHPETLRQLEALFAVTLGKTIRLDLPFLLSTKGEVCRQAADVLLNTDLLPTNSCDETERGQKDASSHCGCCTSCILRCAALHFVYQGKDPTHYRESSAERSISSRIEYEQQSLRLGDLRSYADLLQMDPSIRHIEPYARTHGPLAGRDFEDAFLATLKRNAAQMLAFLRFPQSEKPPAVRGSYVTIV